MDRKKFVKITSMVSAGVVVGFDLSARTSHHLVDIGTPNFHVRHGLYNLQVVPEREFFVQRDVFGREGLSEVSNERISTIRLRYGAAEVFAILDENGLTNSSDRLSVQKLSKNRTYKIDVGSCLIFSEFERFRVDGVSVSENQACITRKGSMEVASNRDQYLVIYKL
ncbi:MAG: hypothetical protein MRY83_11375 [Flavobacteriales bacterium]|nr:hypothetical protein [Flavobacteriales bacterium]